MPTVLSQEEVARLIASAQNLMHRTMLMMLNRILPSQDTHRASVPTVFRSVVHTALSTLGCAVHKVTMRVHGYVHSMEGQDVTLLKMLDNHVRELRLCLHNLQLPMTTVPQLLRLECWPVSAAAYELTAVLVEVSRGGP
jgi:hypothetical protein